MSATGRSGPPLQPRTDRALDLPATARQELNLILKLGKDSARGPIRALGSCDRGGDRAQPLLPEKAVEYPQLEWPLLVEPLRLHPRV